MRIVGCARRRDGGVEGDVRGRRTELARKQTKEGIMSLNCYTGKVFAQLRRLLHGGKLCNQTGWMPSFYLCPSLIVNKSHQRPAELSARTQN
jgi:hypothetical protein